MCRELPRWSTARLIVPSYSELDILTYSGAPNLKVVDIRCPSSRLNEDSLDLFNGNAPKLEHLHLTNVSLLWSSSILSGLRSLSLLRLNGPNIRQFLQILSACPILRSLVLQQFHPSPNSTVDGDEVSVIDLPDLEQLEISDTASGVVQSLLAHVRILKATEIQFMIDTSLRRTPRPEMVDILQPTISFIAEFLRQTLPCDLIIVAISRDALGFKCMSDERAPVLTVGFLEGPQGSEVVLEQLEKQLQFPPVSLRVVNTESSPSWRRLGSLPSTIELQCMKDSVDAASYLGTPVEVDGVLRWPLPGLRRLLLGQGSCRNAEEILQMARNRKGRLPSTPAVAKELPISLTSLTIGKGCPMDRVSFTKLKAILPEAEVRWEGELTSC